MRSLFLAASLAVAALGSVPALAETPPAAAPANRGYKVDATTIAVLLEDPQAKAVLDADMPGFSTHPQIEMIKTVTLKALQQFAPDRLTDELLAKIQTDLDALGPVMVN